MTIILPENAKAVFLLRNRHTEIAELIKLGHTGLSAARIALRTKAYVDDFAASIARRKNGK